MKKTIRTLSDLASWEQAFPVPSAPVTVAPTVAPAPVETPVEPDLNSDWEKDRERELGGTAEAEDAPATPYGTVRITYNLASNKLVAKFLVDNVVQHYVRPNPEKQMGTTRFHDLDVPDADTLQQVVDLINDAKIPSVKYFASIAKPVDTIADDAAQRPFAPVDENPDPTVEIVGPYSALPQGTPASGSPAVADVYQGRRVLESLAPTDFALAPTELPAEPDDDSHFEWTVYDMNGCNAYDVVGTFATAADAVEFVITAGDADKIEAGHYVAVGPDDEELTVTLTMTVNDAGDADTLTPVELDGDTPLPTPTAAPAPAISTAGLDPVRAELVSEVMSFYQVLGLPIRADVMQLSDKGLSDLLHILRTNNGGSVTVASIVATVEAEYTRFLSSDALKLKTRAINERGHEHIARLQAIERVIGQDVMIAGIKGTEYPKLLAEFVAHMSVVNDSVMSIAQSLGVVIPVDGLSTVAGEFAAIEGLPFSPKHIMYVLEIFAQTVKSLMARNTITQEELRTERARHAEARADLVAVRTAHTAASDAFRTRMEAAQRFIAENTESTWVLRTDNGAYVCKNTPDTVIHSVRDLKLTKELDDALRIPSATRARTVRDQLMATKRFAKVNLTLYRQTLVAEDE